MMPDAAPSPLLAPSAPAGASPVLQVPAAQVSSAQPFPALQASRSEGGIRWRLLLAMILTGVAAGLGAAALSWLIHGVEHLAFGQTEAQARIVTEGTTPERRMLALLGGGLVVTLGWALLQLRGRPVVGVNGAVAADTPARRRPPFFENVMHAVLQIVAVGSGAPIGREVAPRELGALFAGRIVDGLRLDDEMRRLLVACGAAAGLAGVYQVPLAGTVFALEILLARFSIRYGVVALTVSVIATLVARVTVSTETFYVLGQISGSAVTVGWCALIGVLVGLLAAAFRRAVQYVEKHRSQKWQVLWALPLALALTGVVAIWLPQVLGNGRSAAQTAYDGTTLQLCLALLAGKTAVVLLTLRSGAYGGTLTPGVAIGALAGLAAGLGLHLLPVWDVLPGMAGEASVLAAAVAGSVGFLAVSMNAPLTLLLARQATPVADQGAILADDPMTGDDDGDAVGAIGRRHGANGTRVGEDPGFVLVADGLAVGNVAQYRPDALLERGTRCEERYAEDAPDTLEIFGDFVLGLAGALVLAGEDVGGHQPAEVVTLALQAGRVGEFEQADAQGAGNDFHGAQRRVETVAQQGLGIREAAPG